jgi:hypothetical protein
VIDFFGKIGANREKAMKVLEAIIAVMENLSRTF